jgi:hypothetical protein
LGRRARFRRAAVRVCPDEQGKRYAMSTATTMNQSVGFSMDRPFRRWNGHENPGQEAGEISVSWNGIVQDVVHFRTDTDPFAFTVGEAPSSNFLIPEYALNGRTLVPLVEACEGRLAVTVLPGSRCVVEYSDGTTIPIDAEETFYLGPQGKASMDLGPWTFRIRSSQSIEEFKAPLTADLSSGYFMGVSAALHAVFFLLVCLVPPSAHGFLTDPNASENRFMKYMLSSAEARITPMPDQKETPDKDQGGGESGARHRGTEGQAGRRDAADTGRRIGIKGPKHNPDPHMARELTKEMVKSAGILTYLTSANAPTSPFGRETALGVDPENALGILVGNDIGDSFGFGGLGLKGTGRGGGGVAEGSLGDGRLDTIGVGGSRGPGGFEYGRPIDEMKGRTPKEPILITHPAKVKGGLSREVIRRIVRRHLNEIKFCYDQGLLKRADLSGRISIKFLITSNGAVQGATVESSTLDDPSVEVCIAKAVRRMTFPKPEDGGIVFVTYPFALTSAEN